MSSSICSYIFYLILLQVSLSILILSDSIIRSLPPLAKKYVLQLLYIDGPVSAKWLEEWVLADGASKHRVAIDRLVQLRVLTETVER